MEQPKTGTLVCRKCGGPHLTMKCGKDKVVVEEKPTEYKRKTYSELRNEFSKKNPDMQEEKSSSKALDIQPKLETYSDSNLPQVEERSVYVPKEKNINYNEFVERDKNHRHHFKTTHRVKLSNLPTDMTEEEMMELTCDWGNVIRIKVLNYEESSVAYIDFGYMDEATYFIEAIDKTPFEYLILAASIAEDKRT